VINGMRADRIVNQRHGAGGGGGGGRESPNKEIRVCCLYSLCRRFAPACCSLQHAGSLRVCGARLPGDVSSGGVEATRNRLDATTIDVMQGSEMIRMDAVCWQGAGGALQGVRTG
jgi:hypothetical protein